MFTLSLLILTTVMQTPKHAIIAPGATLEKLGGGFLFTEGPAVDPHGNVLFTDQPNDRIMRWNIDGTVTEWMKPCGRSNGIAFDHHGNLVTCADEKNELWSIAPDKKVKVLVKEFGGKLLNGPNDVWIRPDGGLYFTDPLYPRPYWKRDKAMQQSGRHVYYLAAGHHAPVPVATDLTQPNGLVGTPDGKTLYVSDIDAKLTYRYAIQADGSLAHKTLFCRLGSDGMTMDNEGNVYLTGDGVTVFDKSGAQIEHIPIAESWTGNIKFGGADRHLLFITASTSIYGIKMRVKGVQ